MHLAVHYTPPYAVAAAVILLVGFLFGCVSSNILNRRRRERQRELIEKAEKDSSSR